MGRAGAGPGLNQNQDGDSVKLGTQVRSRKTVVGLCFFWDLDSSLILKVQSTCGARGIAL